MEEDDPRRKEAEEIRKAGNRAAALTRQLLAFSRRQVLQPEVVDLNRVVRELETMLRRLIGEDVDLVTSLDAALGRVKVDPGQIEQVIVNLVVNARDAMPGGGKITIRTGNVITEGEAAWGDGTVPPGSYSLLEIARHRVRHRSAGRSPTSSSRFSPRRRRGREPGSASPRYTGS